MFHQLRAFPLVLFILLTVSLLEKVIFLLYHAEQFRELSTIDTFQALAWGLKFDLAIGAALGLIAYFTAYLGSRLLRQKFLTVLRYLTFIAISVLVMLHGADMLYFDEAGRHLGYELKESFNSGAALAVAAMGSYIVPVVLQFLLLIPLYLFNSKLFDICVARSEKRAVINPAHMLGPEVSLILTFIAAITLVRGGFSSVPLEPLHAQEIGNSRQASLALNGAYNAIFSSVTPYSINSAFSAPLTSSDITLVRNLYQRQDPITPNGGSPKPYNVIIVFLESWSGAYMAPYGYGKRTTPFFDQLLEISVTARAMLAGGHRTTEGMFATLCSWQNPLGKTVAQTQLQNYDYHCLPRILADRGYSSAFFQSTLKNTSGTGAFAQLLGYHESYGKKDFGITRYPTNSWGYHDPDLYEFSLAKMRGMTQPFLIGINTNSTHDRSLPDGVERPFTGDGNLTNYFNALHFSDRALEEFVANLEKEGLMKNSILVLVGDHAGVTPSFPMAKYMVPFAILAPDTQAINSNHIASQRDIAPTVLQMLGLPVPKHFTGISLLKSNGESFADYYHQGLLGWVVGNKLYQTPIKGKRLDCFLLGKSPLETEPSDCEEKDRAHGRDAIAFTHLSQSLLFNGKTEQFPLFLKGQLQ